MQNKSKFKMGCLWIITLLLVLLFYTNPEKSDYLNYALEQHNIPEELKFFALFDPKARDSIEKIQRNNYLVFSMFYDGKAIYIGILGKFIQVK